MRLSVVLALIILFCPIVVFAQTDTLVAVAPDSVAADETATSGAGLGEVEMLDAEEFAHAEGDTIATVSLLGQDLFDVRAVSVLGAERRADDIEEAIESISESVRRRPEDVHLLRDDRIGATMVLCDEEFILATFDYEAAQFGTSADELAMERAEIIRQAMLDYREDFSARSLIRGAIISGVVLVVIIIGLTILTRFRRRFEGFLEHRLENRTVFRVVSGESLISLASIVDRLVWFAFVIWVWLMFLNFALGQFPWTHGFASQVWALAAGPAKTLGRQALDQVPSLFFLAFIFVVAVLVNRGLRFVFDEIGARRIYIRGFYPDWAHPTFNIARLVVIGFAVVVAIPYIPGSGSGAFKGMSLFVGVLVSLGSGSAMANAISGVIMIYMRPFEIGDRVQIGQTVGDVVDRNLLTTKIRTPKNERVTIPNTSILSGQIINFSSKRRTKELILHTTLTLGYDVPWRQIHELLIGAAKTTENILQDPEPFVLQRALHDFYVEYELNAYTGDPKAMPRTYSNLHQNIQDKFNEAGVEILSPHYRAHRNGELEGDAPQVTSPGA